MSLVRPGDLRSDPGGSPIALDSASALTAPKMHDLDDRQEAANRPSVGYPVRKYWGGMTRLYPARG